MWRTTTGGAINEDEDSSDTEGIYRDLKGMTHEEKLQKLEQKEFNIKQVLDVARERKENQARKKEKITLL